MICVTSYIFVSMGIGGAGGRMIGWGAGEIPKLVTRLQRIWHAASVPLGWFTEAWFEMELEQSPELMSLLTLSIVVSGLTGKPDKNSGTQQSVEITKSLREGIQMSLERINMALHLMQMTMVSPILLVGPLGGFAFTGRFSNVRVEGYLCLNR